MFLLRNLQTWPIADTPASVRPDTRTSTRDPSKRARWSSRLFWTDGRISLFSWVCQPQKSVPRYATLRAKEVFVCCLSGGGISSVCGSEEKKRRKHCIKYHFGTTPEMEQRSRCLFYNDSFHDFAHKLKRLALPEQPQSLMAITFNPRHSKDDMS